LIWQAVIQSQEDRERVLREESRDGERKAYEKKTWQVLADLSDGMRVSISGRRGEVAERSPWRAPSFRFRVGESPPEVSDTDKLSIEASEIAGDMFRFLIEVGPKPKTKPLEYYKDMSEDEILSDDEDKISSYVDRIHYGYASRFKSRVQNLLLELKSRHLVGYELDGRVDPMVQTADNIQSLAEKFILLSMKMDLADSGGSS
jgi:hypothetical protein